MKSQKQNLTALVLAGGKSTRMGKDKAFLLYKNKMFIHHVIDAVLPLTKSVFIVSDDTKYDNLGFQRIEDFIKDAGPLSGIVSGLQNIKTSHALVVTCDVPLIKAEMLQMLLLQAKKDKEYIIQLKTKSDTMPLLAIYPKSCLLELKKSLLSGNRKVKLAIENCKVKTVVLPSFFEKYVQNINTPSQFYKLNESSD